MRVLFLFAVIAGSFGLSTVGLVSAQRHEPNLLSRSVTVPAACRDLGISTSLGYELIAKGEFPCRVIRAGRRLIVPRAELDRLLGNTRPASDNADSML